MVFSIVSLIYRIIIDLLIISYRLLFIVGLLVKFSFKSFYKAFRFVVVSSKVLLFFLIYFKYILEYLFNSIFYSFIGIDINLL